MIEPSELTSTQRTALTRINKFRHVQTRAGWKIIGQAKGVTSKVARSLEAKGLVMISYKGRHPQIRTTYMGRLVCGIIDERKARRANYQKPSVDA